MRERRSRDMIILEILTICSEGKNVTGIVYGANTNFSTIRDYLNLMIKKDLIEPIKGSPKLYKTTRKGLIMKEKLKALQVELDEIKL